MPRIVYEESDDDDDDDDDDGGGGSNANFDDDDRVRHRAGAAYGSPAGGRVAGPLRMTAIEAKYCSAEFYQRLLREVDAGGDAEEAEEVDDADAGVGAN